MKSGSNLKILNSQFDAERQGCLHRCQIILILVICVLAVKVPAQVSRVTFKVVSPVSTPRDAKIFIAGNDSSLGNWDPGGIELHKINDSIWIGNFQFEHGTSLEYKITRGAWNVQAVYENRTIPGNNRLVVQRDTEVLVRPVLWSDGLVSSAGGITGMVRYIRDVKGKGLRYARDLIVWLPPSYLKDPTRRYPVLYMHDGQNIIDPRTSFAGFDWRVDEVVDSLVRVGRIKEIIVVGIYNSPDRMTEYSDSDLGRIYAGFVVSVVKPMIDTTFRTLPDRSNTAIMGSSLGGLVSFLFAWWYPDVFSKAGCLSSVFSYNDSRILKEVEASSGPRKNIQIYMDCGGFAGEATLKLGMDSMVGLLRARGYIEGEDFEFFYDASAEHSERAWAARVWRPLEFFFGK